MIEYKLPDDLLLAFDMQAGQVLARARRRGKPAWLTADEFETVVRIAEEVQPCPECAGRRSACKACRGERCTLSARGEAIVGWVWQEQQRNAAVSAA